MPISASLHPYSLRCHSLFHHIAHKMPIRCLYAAYILSISSRCYSFATDPCSGGDTDCVDEEEKVKNKSDSHLAPFGGAAQR